MWIPTGVGVFSTVVAFGLGATDDPIRADFFIYFIAILLKIAVGAIGSGLHINQNLTSQGVVVGERFIHGAPFLAPLLFADIGMIGLVALLDPVEERTED